MRGVSIYKFLMRAKLHFQMRLHVADFCTSLREVIKTEDFNFCAKQWEEEFRGSKNPRNALRDLRTSPSASLIQPRVHVLYDYTDQCNQKHTHLYPINHCNVFDL